MDNTQAKAPVFTNSEINWLYKEDLSISEDKINTILSLPRESLISDLEKVLQDGIDRYDYFYELYDYDEFERKNFYFMIHAFFFLGEIEARETITSIINTLSQEDDFYDFYFGDYLTEVLWEPIYKIFKNNKEEAKQFMLKPDVYLFCKTPISQAFVQIALNEPEQKTEIVQWYNEILNYYYNYSIEDNITEPDLNYLITGPDLNYLIIKDVIKLESEELLPVIKKFIDNKVVNGIDSSDLFENALKEDEDIHLKFDILPIAEKYQEILGSWLENPEKYTNMFDELLDKVFDESEEDIDFEDIEYEKTNKYDEEIKPIRNEPKIGRNEPCPCGSGKKYKKCCMNK